MSDYQIVLTEPIDSVGIVTFNRPKQMNALDRTLTRLSVRERNKHLGVASSAPPVVQLPLQ